MVTRLRLSRPALAAVALLVAGLAMAGPVQGASAASGFHFDFEWGSSGTGNGQFGIPVGGMTADAAGNVYVVDSGNDRIQKFDADGTYVDQWGSFGSGA